MRRSRSVFALLLVVAALLLSVSMAAAASTLGQTSINVACRGKCAPEPPCNLDIPDGSVVGSLPLDQIAFYAPGKITVPNITVNAGTYWVTGIGTADDGSQFYRIVISCQYLYVPLDTMQPSYQSPWNGEPLPTNEVS